MEGVPSSEARGSDEPGTSANGKSLGKLGVGWSDVGTSAYRL